MTTRPSRPWLLPALIALILAIGNLAANWVAADLQETLEPVRWLVWAAFAISLVVAIVIAVREARRPADPAPGGRQRRRGSPISQCLQKVFRQPCAPAGDHRNRNGFERKYRGDRYTHRVERRVGKSLSLLAEHHLGHRQRPRSGGRNRPSRVRAADPGAAVAGRWRLVRAARRGLVGVELPGAGSVVQRPAVDALLSVLDPRC